MTMKLRIVKTDKDGLSGHITVHCRVYDPDDATDGTGALEVHGIEPLELERAFGGDIQRWLSERVAVTMKSRHQSRVTAQRAMREMRGTEIDID